MDFSGNLIEWYVKNKRDLPWRNTVNPYKIWLSEIMLQQTRVAQGLPYYMSFVEEFPTVTDLAKAHQDKVLKMWQGLGYYSRARNLHETAKKVAFEYDGVFPDTYKELLKLKGVGDYTASAIASISFNEPRPVVDGNVYRVLARYFGVRLPINSNEGVKYFKELAEKVKDSEQIAVYNQAIMEFGALMCKPKNPDCEVCPIQKGCKAYVKNEIDMLPVKLKTVKVSKRYFNYIVLLDNENNTVLVKRTGKGIWHNLFEFPLFETNETLHEASDVLKHEYFKKYKPEVIAVNLYNEKEIVHKLSHQHLYTRFWVVKVKGELPESIPATSLNNYAVPVLVAKFIEGFVF